jgi:uncharacterized protein YbjQ (UPF0145 family)
MMPFFHHKSDEEKQREQEEKQHRAEELELQQRSEESLKAGGIPVQAQRRLDDLRNRKGALFTSDLSVNEFLLSREAGLRPVSQVMGSSIYHVGWQRTPGQYSYYATSQELTVISQAMNHARNLALGRLLEEATRLDAHAVIGVRINRARYEWASDLLEFSAMGTAVRVEGGPVVERPVLSNLSGQEFWQLYRSGYWPVGVAAGSSVFYVVASWQTQMANNSFWGSFANMELQDFTHGLYTARHLAVGRVRSDAHTLGAHGVVGVTIDSSEQEHEVDLGNDQERTDMIFTFHALGTAIMPFQQKPQVPRVQQFVNLRS